MLNFFFTTLQRLYENAKSLSINWSQKTTKTSKVFERPESTSVESSPTNDTVRHCTYKKNKLECGSLNGNLEIDDIYLNENIKTERSDQLNGSSIANYL